VGCLAEGVGRESARRPGVRVGAASAPLISPMPEPREMCDRSSSGRPPAGAINPRARVLRGGGRARSGREGGGCGGRGTEGRVGVYPDQGGRTPIARDAAARGLAEPSRRDAPSPTEKAGIDGPHVGDPRRNSATQTIDMGEGRSG